MNPAPKAAPGLAEHAAAVLAKILTPAQWEELRAAHPGLTDPQPAASPDPSLPGEPARAAKLTKADEERYTKLYAANWRTVRRWIEKGHAANDPCPLHDPQRMPAWWTRVIHRRVPEGIEQAAADAALHAAQAPAGSASAVPGDDRSPHAAPGEPVPPPPMPAGKPIDIAALDPEEGDRLRQLKQIAAAKWNELRDAYNLGQDCELKQQRWSKLVDSIDRIETRVTERLKKRGLYRLKAEVDHDLAYNAELMRQIDASQERRVLERCPSLTPEQRSEVADAIRQSNRSKERLLSRLNSMSGDDLLRELAA